MNNTMMDPFLEALNVQGYAALLAGIASLLCLLIALLVFVSQRLAGGILVHVLWPVVQPVVAGQSDRCEAVAKS